jgi:hypothetical protein
MMHLQKNLTHLVPDRYLSSIEKPSSIRRSEGLKPVASKVSRRAHLYHRSVGKR